MTDETIVDLVGYAGIRQRYTAAVMRIATDWQLQKVLKFMKKHEQMFGGSGMIFILKDAMRPQQQDDNQ